LLLVVVVVQAAHEMKQLLRSILKLDAAVRNVFESHIFIDGGIQGKRMGQYAIQLVTCLREEVDELKTVDVEEWIASGKRIVTPYGMRIEWQLPNGTPFAIHLKDATLVKAKKRWSQVMFVRSALYCVVGCVLCG
jgi:chitin synthase